MSPRGSNGTDDYQDEQFYQEGQTQNVLDLNAESGMASEVVTGQRP